ncbi:MAG: S9 family peptidase [Bacteroidetes bacterium]|nr:S9 family peptidase [Bacteroidota bacterium]
MKKFSVVVVVMLISLTTFSQQELFNSYDLFKLESVSGATLSPNGKFIAYIMSVPRPFSDKPGGSYRELHVLTVSTGKSRPFITGKKSVGSVYWTPDSKYITLTGKLNDEKHSQIYKIAIDGGSPIAVTDVKYSIYSYDWNPKQNSIAYVGVEKDKSRESLIKKGFNAEVVEEHIPHRNIYLLNLDDNVTEKITSDISAYSIKWNPTGTMIAAQMTEKNLIDWSYMFKRIYLVDPKAKTFKMLVENPGKLGSMSWSPDGKQIAFIAGADINDPVSGSLYVASVPGPNKFVDLKNHLKDMELSVTSVKWKDSKTLLITSDEGVNTALSQLTVGSSDRKFLVEPGKLIFRGLSIVGNTIVISGNTQTSPSGLYTVDAKKGTLKQLTDLNGWLAKKKFGKQERFEYKSRDGIRMEGILIYPVDYKDGSKYPLISYIHGGPESCVKNGWVTYYSMWGQVASSKGYFVFMPNYRGSSGRGIAFSKMDQKDQGDEEFNDVLDGIDQLVKDGKVDKDRVGIGGGSYGGYFAGWAATKHSQHFAAAVVFVGISDQISKRFTTDIPYESYYSHWNIWVHEDYELVYDRSPVKYATNGQTPTLILHGKNDPRVHPSQSLELFRALKMHGKAPVRLVWYPGEGHGNRKNPARLDYSIRTLEWFDYYLQSGKSRDEMPRAELEFSIDEVKIER